MDVSMGRLAAALGMVAGALALTSTSVHGQEAELEVSISGRTEVGRTLRAEVRPSGDHEYEWRRCRTRALDSCETRIGGSSEPEAQKRGRRQVDPGASHPARAGADAHSGTYAGPEPDA